MLIQGIKSRPCYEPLRWDATGTRHLLLIDQETIPAGAIAEDSSMLASIERWSVTRLDTDPHAQGDNQHSSMRRFQSKEHLLSQLPARLKNEIMGLRLYVIGTEDFLWDIAGVARQAGLGEQEIHLTHAGSKRRRVYCAHCRALNQDITKNICVCTGCGAHLFVRDHFSRRLAAYMGVQVDAEVPGMLPPIEEIYP